MLGVYVQEPRQGQDKLSAVDQIEIKVNSMTWMERFLSLPQEENTIGIITKGGGGNPPPPPLSIHIHSSEKAGFLGDGELLKAHVSSRLEVLSESLTLTLQPNSSDGG